MKKNISISNVAHAALWIVAAAVSSGCTTAPVTEEWIKPYSATAMGCTVDEVKISNINTITAGPFGVVTAYNWNASCNGKLDICSEVAGYMGGSQYICAPRASGS